MEKKKLSEFLKENGAYESFIENCLNDMITITACIDYKLSNIGFIDGFGWNRTPEGIDYWEKLFDKKGEEGDIIYDMDEILYKEYEKRNNINISEDKTENTKQEFQTITLNGLDYYLIPKSESPLLTLKDLRDIGLSEKDLLENGFSGEDLRKDSREEYLKRKFEENKGKYIVLFKEKKSKEWSFCYRPNYLSWRKDWDYKLIKKEHKEIIEAYLKDKNVKIEYHFNFIDVENVWGLIEEDFIEHYDEDNEYRIAKKEFEPFTLNIEVKTLDEAKSLWNRFNLNYGILCRAMKGQHYNVQYYNKIDTYKYWEQIDSILKYLGEVPDVKEEN